MEKRYKISQVQYEAVADAQNRVVQLQALYAEAMRHAGVVQKLVNDALGIEGRPKQHIDPETRELVVQLEPPGPSDRTS